MMIKPPVVQFANDNVRVVDEDQGTVEIKLALSDPSDFTPEVTYVVNDETSTAVSDDFSLATTKAVKFDGTDRK